MRLALPAGLSLAILLAAVPGRAAPKVWNQDWSVGERPLVRVRVDDAHVRIRRGPDGRVATRVEYELTTHGIVFGEGSPSVMFERSGNTIQIQARDPHGFGVIGSVVERYTVSITVPREVELEVRSADGAIDCDSLQGRIQLESGDGTIRAHALKGSVEVSSGDGRVILNDLDGELRTRVGDGHVTVAGRFDVLELRSSDGRLDATARKGSKVTEAWSLESRDGAVVLRVPIDIAALLDARTRDGSLRLRIPIPATDHERNAILGELNGGGPPLRLRTRDGSLTLALAE